MLFCLVYSLMFLLAFKRAGNSVAHLAARLQPACGDEQIFVSSIPQGLLALAELDLLP